MRPARAPLDLTLDPKRIGVHARIFAYALLVVCYVLMKLGPEALLAPVLSGLSLVAILVSLPASSVGTRVLTGLFSGGGVWMLHHSAVGLPAFLGAFGDMTYLVALFAVVPVLCAPIRVGRYATAIESVLHGRIKGAFGLNAVATTLAYACGSFMSMAAVPIMMTSLKPVVGSYPLANKVRFMAVSATIGYVLPTLWTPVSGVVGLVLSSLRVDWLSVLPNLFALSVAGLGVHAAIFYVLEVHGRAPRSGTTEAAPELHRATSPRSKLVEMAVAIVLLIGTIILVERWLGIGFIHVTILVSIPFALAWSAVIGQAGHFLEDAAQDLLDRLPRMADLVAIFLSAGFFARAMHLSGLDHLANVQFLDLYEVLGNVGFLVAMPIMALVAAFLGVHPLVAIALLGEALNPEQLGIRPEQLAITLIGSAVLTYMLGPFSGTLGLVQSLTGVSTFRLSIWNAPYAAGFFLLLVAAIMLT